MKAIINGKVFDTETAERLAEADNGHLANDLIGTLEILYRSPKGQLFIHGEGGALSKYGMEDQNGYTEGEEILLVNEKEAFEFCAENNLVEEAQKLFPHLIEEG